MIRVNYFDVDDQTLTLMKTERLSNNYGYPVIGSHIDFDGVMWEVVDVDAQPDVKFNICEFDVYVSDRIYTV